MGFRFHKRSGLLGGLLHLNWSKNGLSSISIGKPGATLNIPVARSGSTRTTVRLPGTGLSWSEEVSAHRSVQQRRQRQKAQVTSTEQIIQELLLACFQKDPRCLSQASLAFDSLQGTFVVKSFDPLGHVVVQERALDLFC